MRKATDSLNALSDVDNDDETRKTLATLSLRQLESRVAQLLDDLQNRTVGSRHLQQSACLFADSARARTKRDVRRVSAAAANP